MNDRLTSHLLVITRWCRYCNRVFTPQSHNQKYCSYTCRWNAKIEKSELQTPITADVEHQIKQLVAKFGEKKVREVLDSLIKGME